MVIAFVLIGPTFDFCRSLFCYSTLPPAQWKQVFAERLLVSFCETLDLYNFLSVLSVFFSGYFCLDFTPAFSHWPSLRPLLSSLSLSLFCLPPLTLICLLFAFDSRWTLHLLCHRSHHEIELPWNARSVFISMSWLSMERFSHCRCARVRLILISKTCMFLSWSSSRFTHLLFPFLVLTAERG